MGVAYDGGFQLAIDADLVRKVTVTLVAKKPLYRQTCQCRHSEIRTPL